MKFDYLYLNLMVMPVTNDFLLLICKRGNKGFEQKDLGSPRHKVW